MTLRIAAAVAALVTLAPLPALANTIANGGFSNGFTSWQGLIDDGVTASVDPAADPHFLLPTAGFAQVANDSTDYAVSLLQAFALPSASAGALSLRFDFDWNKTSGLLDVVQALLLDAAGAPLLDLFPSNVDTTLAANTGTAIMDVTAFAGRNVILAFRLEDGDYQERDTLSVGNIAVHTTPVPLPASWALLLSGLALPAMLSRRPRRPFLAA